MNEPAPDYRLSPGHNAQPPPPWRRVAGDAARWSWPVVAALAISLIIVAIPGRYEQLLGTADYRSLFRLGLSPGFYAGYQIGLILFVMVFHILIAAILYLRRLDDPMALFVAYALVANGALLPLALTNDYGSLDPLAWLLLAGVVRFTGLFTSFGILYLFPDGRLAPRAARWAALGWGLVSAGSAFLPQTRFSLSQWPGLVQGLVLLVFGGLGIYIQAYRYQYIATQLQRQQVKWAFLGLAAALLGPFAYFAALYLSALPSATGGVPNLLYQRVGSGYYSSALLAQLAGQTLTALYLLLLPLSFSIAVLRYRLWDIDIIIRRTLIYSSLTAVVGAIYVTSIALLQFLFRNWTESSQFVVVLSTLFSAMLFRPLFRRIQNSIDRSFFRSRYDAEKTLQVFSGILRNEVELDRLVACLQGVVQSTLQPARSGVWLKHAAGGRKVNGAENNLPAEARADEEGVSNHS